MKTLLYTLMAVIMFGCHPTLLAEFEDKPVVSCYLDAGASPTLTIKKLVAFRDDVQYSNEDVNKLSITITDQTDGQSYVMQAQGGGEYVNSQLVVATGHTYSLSFIYNGNPITATTTIPEAPQDVEFSASSIGVMSFGPMASKSDMMPDQGIEITWNNNDKNYYIIEGITSSDDAIREIEDEDEEEYEFPKNFRLDYTQSNTATLSQSQFNYYGYYEVSLIRIQAEYVVMSQGSSDSSTTLVDVKGNISGGYGIFSGINRFKKSILIYEETK